MRVHLQFTNVEPSEEDAAQVKPPEYDGIALLQQYQSMVGCLLYLANVTRPDICFATNTLARYMSRPTPALLEAAKEVLRYCKATKHYKLVFRAARGSEICAGTCGVAKMYSDADWANDVETRRSVSGAAIMLHGDLIHYKSGLQRVIATSTYGSECIAMSSLVQEAMYLKKLLRDLGLEQRPMPLLGDNQAANSFMENPIQDGKSKHIDVCFKLIRERVSNGDVKVSYVKSNDNLADIFTKPLTGRKFVEMRERLNLRE
jgi:hypothetical protein